MKGWLRLAFVLSVFWLIGCGIVLLIELSQFPQSRAWVSDKPALEAFFRSTKISAVHDRHPPLGVDTPTDYYHIAFDGKRFLRIAIFPAIAIFAAVLTVACGTRWVVRGFKS
jgi:hypothetical protein